MRVLFTVLALILACGAMTFAAAGDSTMSSAVTPPAMSSENPSGQAMIDACLSRCLNVTQQQIGELRSKGCTDPDIAIACAIASKASKPLNDVAAKYQSCKNWTQVAGGYNLSMADLMSAPVSASPDSEAFNCAFFAQYYAIPQSQIAQVRRQGCSWDDVNLCANAALSTNQPITDIARMRQQGSSWAEIAVRYSVSSASLISPAKVRLVSTYDTSGSMTTGAGPAPCPAPCPAACPPSGPAPCPAAGPAPCPQPCPTVCPAATGSPCANGPCIVCDGSGNVILNYDQVVQLYADGNDWLDVAIAVNVVRYTGYPIRQVLSDLKSQGTWQQNLIYYGVPQEYAYNVTDYPFLRRSRYSPGVDAQNYNVLARFQKPGSWPTCPRGNPPCPGGVGMPVTVVPVPCPNPCGTGPVCPTTPGVTYPAPAPAPAPSTP